MDLSFVQVWSPHNVPLSGAAAAGIAAETATLHPLALSTSCTLLCRLLDTAKAENPPAPTMVVATWSPSLAYAGSVFHAFRFPSSHGFATQIATGEKRSDENQLATPSTSHARAPLLVSPGDSSANQGESVKASWTVLRTRDDRAVDSHPTVGEQYAAAAPQADRHRLRLGPLLYAPAWRSLFSRLNRSTTDTLKTTNDSGVESSPKCSNAPPLALSEDCLRDATASTTAAAAVAADWEAIAVLFPAIHHGTYFATPQAFERHCLYSDDHLLWCEDAPLMTVEWIAEEPQCTKTSAVADGRESVHRIDVASVAPPPPRVNRRTEEECPSSGRLNTSRKRRRIWLQKRRSTAAWCNSPFTLRFSQCSPTRIGEDVNGREGLLPSTTVANVECWLLKGPCTYALSCTQSDESTTVTTAADACPRSSPLPAGELITGTQEFAAWYSELYLACRGQRASVRDSLESTAEAAVPRQLKEAAVEVLFHGIVTSLALWCCCGHKAYPCTIMAENVASTAVLLRNWWRCLTLEAGVLRDPTPQLPGVLAERGKIAAAVFRVFLWHHQPRSLPMHNSSNAGSTGEALKARVPPFFPSLTLDCAAAITRHHRRTDQKQCWWPARQACEPHEASSEAPCSLAESEEKTLSDAASCATVLSSRAADCVLASTRNDGNEVRRHSADSDSRRRENYVACLELVLQLLFAEQHTLLTAAAQEAP
jgi:hypothetical protein